MQLVDSNVLALPGDRRALALLGAAGVVDALCVAGQALCLACAVTLVWEAAGWGEAAGAAAATGLTGSLGDAAGPAVAGWVAGFAACYAVRQLVACARSSAMDRYARARAGELRRCLLERTLEGGPAFVQERGTAAVTTSLLEGVERVQTYLATVLPKVADLVALPAVLIALLFALDWVSGLIALVGLPCAFMFMRLLGSMAKEKAARQHGEYRRMSNHFVDTLRGLSTLKLFGRTREAGEQVFQTSERFREATVRTLRVATLSSLVLDLVGTAALAGVAIMLGFRLMDGSVALMPALAALVAVPECYGAVRRFSADFHASLDGRNALAEIVGMLGPEQGFAGEKSEGEKSAAVDPASVAGEKHAAGRPAAPCASVKPWSSSSTLTLRGAGFSYRSPDGAHRALDGIDLELRGFERLGVVGASGSGKSTLAALLAGFAAPDRGTVELDGHAIPDGLHCDAWRRQVAFIPQTPHIFSATLRENLVFYRPDASDAAIEDALRAVGLAELVARLPRGLQTPVGEGGRRLSGGQAQRVALARALLDDRRRVWVLDEPTAHLDVETELALKECMLPLMEGRAVVLATHRLHWLGAMDRAVVLEGGRPVQEGTPEQLRAAGPGSPFARLALQLGGGELR